MIKVRKSNKNELKAFWEMEQQSHAAEYINGTDLEKHQEDFKKPNLVYLSIENHNGELAGYFILAISSSKEEVEFRRVIIDQNQRGIGQIAITQMEAYCREKLNCKNIWLDVYEDNSKGRHVYEKLAYKKFKEGNYNGRELFYYRKEQEKYIK